MLNRFAFGVCLLAIGAAILEVEPPRGLDFLHQNSPTRQKYLIETMGGGIALLDYNNDGLLDIFVVNGGRLTDRMPSPESFDRQDPRYWNRLYRQNRDGSFTDVTQQAGLANAGNGNYGMGVAAADYDNDGYTDLYVTSYGKNILYHNNGDGTFTDVTQQGGRRGWRLVRFCRILRLRQRRTVGPVRHALHGVGYRAQQSLCAGDSYCPPGDFPATTNVLYHNRGDGTFEDVSRRSGIANTRAALWEWLSMTTMATGFPTYL